jgi:hypothetical protein
MTDDSIARREFLNKRAAADLRRGKLGFAAERQIELEGNAGPAPARAVAGLGQRNRYRDLAALRGDFARRAAAAWRRGMHKRPDPPRTTQPPTCHTVSTQVTMKT